jgi:hypothetical protein
MNAAVNKAEARFVQLELALFRQPAGSSFIGTYGRLSFNSGKVNLSGLHLLNRIKDSHIGAEPAEVAKLNLIEISLVAPILRMTCASTGSM